MALTSQLKEPKEFFRLRYFTLPKTLWCTRSMLAPKKSTSFLSKLKTCFQSLILPQGYGKDLRALHMLEKRILSNKSFYIFNDCTIFRHGPNVHRMTLPEFFWKVSSFTSPTEMIGTKHELGYMSLHCRSCFSSFCSFSTYKMIRPPDCR